MIGRNSLVRGGEALAHATQRNSGCFIHGVVQDQVGWDHGQPNLVTVNPAHNRVVGTR